LTGLIAKDPSVLPNPGETTSVNGNEFFRAPVATAECLSNVGATADKACSAQTNYPTAPTAQTSPYEYVTFAVAPGCTQIGNNCDVAKEWDADCTNPHCYGVPLYRQYLTKGEQPLRQTGGACVADPNLVVCRPIARTNPGILNECKKVCGTWAAKDLDCPPDGCLGFAVKFPNDPADNGNHRPTPAAFPTIAVSPWLTLFQRTAREPDSVCQYLKVPGTDCNKPN
jgi:hypothetical protein